MKTLIVIDNLNTGGVATALYNFINHASKYMTCDLLVFDENGIDRTRIPKNVNVIRSSRGLHILGKRQKDIKVESIFLAYIRILLFGLARIIGGERARMLIWPFVKEQKGYDLAISYAQDDAWNSLSKGCNDYVRLKVNAKKKVAVIHCDYSNFGGGNSKQEKGFSQFDYVMCLSKSCKKSFLSQFPGLKNKCIVCENFIDDTEIKKKSWSSITYSADTINIVTIARLSEEKGIERGLKSFLDLKKEGFNNFKWIIVGDGPEKEKILKIITDYGLESCVELVGNKKNPYRYLKNATAFLLPSYNEAAPMVYGECEVLKIPILTTDTCSAIELVEERGVGIVCKNTDEAITKMLRELLTGEIDIKVFKIKESDINREASKQFVEFLEKIEKEC